MELAWQASLFAAEPPAVAAKHPDGSETAVATDPTVAGFAGLRRIHLDQRSWLDLARGWVRDHDELFELLLREAPWRQRERRMYDRDVLEPRLVAVWDGDALGALPAQIATIRDQVSDRYDVDFDSVLVNLYRDGRDGVAWHGDTVRKRLSEAVVVTVALGERRSFLLRPGESGPATVRLTTGEGDLLVMGGRCQNEWMHTVPKASRAGARMSVTMRHSAPLPRS